MDNVKFLHDCIVINNILVVGDLHIGYEGQFAGRVVVPHIQLREIIEKFEEIFDVLKKGNIEIKKIVLLGDVKHDFGKITDQEWSDALKLFDFFLDKIQKREGEKIVVVKGNHDNILTPIIKKREGIILKDYYCEEGVCFLHGNKMDILNNCLNSESNINTLVFGHLHPAITLSDHYKSEKFKCFLRGKWKSYSVIILPSFSEVSIGYELMDLEEDDNYDKGDHFFVIDKKSLKKLRVVIYNNKDNKEHDFGYLKDLI